MRNAPTAVRAVIRNFGWLAASRGVAAVFSLVYLAIITRSLGVSGFGKFALITGAAQLIASVLAFQTWQVIVQYGVNHLENGDDTRLARLFRSAALLDVGSALAGIGAAALFLHVFAEPLGMTPTLARATLIFNVIMLLSFRSTPLGILRLRDRFNYAAFADSVTPTMRLIGALLAWAIHPKLQGFLIAWAAAELITAAAHWYAVHRTGDLRLMLREGRGMRKVLDENPDFVRYALTSNFSQSLFTAARQLPLFLVGGLTGTAAAGAFRLAAQLSRSMTTLGQMIARAAFPEIVRAIRRDGVASLRAIIVRSMRVTLIVSTLVFLLVVVFGKAVLVLVGGPDFGIGYVSLLWLAAAACTDLVIVAFEPSISAARRVHFAFLARLAGTAVMIGAALLLEPVHGADGVAAAVFASVVCQALILGVTLLAILRKGDIEAPAEADAARLPDLPPEKH